MNFVEQLPLIIALLYITSLQVPLVSLILSIFYFVVRLVYAVGYYAKGPNFRGFGAIPILLCLIILFGYSFYTCSEFIKFYSKDIMTVPAQNQDG